MVVASQLTVGRLGLRLVALDDLINVDIAPPPVSLSTILISARAYRRSRSISQVCQRSFSEPPGSRMRTDCRRSRLPGDDEVYAGFAGVPSAADEKVDVGPIRSGKRELVSVPMVSSPWKYEFHQPLAKIS